MINIILIIIVVTVIVVLVLAARRPDNFVVTRTAAISAPASAIFPHVNNLHNWDPWSPWAKLDPNAKNSFEGPDAGVGAKMSWVGNNKVGVGSMAITESRPDDFVQFKLEFQKPMQATNQSEFSFKPEAGQTAVTWSMSGTNNFMAKVMGVFMNVDKMVGGQFEQGLANLKAVVEGSK
jgi:Polyketide cyclase / dehydrase and lipid transport